jgi:hypothetical protein
MLYQDQFMPSYSHKYEANCSHANSIQCKIEAVLTKLVGFARRIILRVHSLARE